MFGCCGAEGVKFKTMEGAIDVARLNKLLNDMREAGLDEKHLERMKECECLCHQDGITCLC